MEDPSEAKKRGAKSIVKRAVKRIVTQGTLIEETLLDARSHNYLAAIAEAGGKLGLAWVEISTGEFLTQPLEVTYLATALARISPGELLVSDILIKKQGLCVVLDEWAERLSVQPQTHFDHVKTY